MHVEKDTIKLNSREDVDILQTVITEYLERHKGELTHGRKEELKRTVEGLDALWYSW